MLANGLWEAGAEAISINGHRLSSLTAIRSAGDAITVDYRSLTRPYRVEAIGDPRTLQAHFVESSAGAWWNDLAQNRRMRYEISDVKQLDLAADPGMVLRHGGGDIVIPLLGLLAGIVLGIVLEPSIPQRVQPYLPIAIVAAMDALFGAFRAYLEGNFTDRVFVVSFISNVLIAAAIVYVGDQIGVGSQLATAVVVVLGIRIFTQCSCHQAGALPCLTRHAAMARSRAVAARAISHTVAQRRLSPCHLATAQPTPPDRRGASDDRNFG